jgi:hypothetical protein
VSQAQTTTDHEEIRAWIEQRKGRPSVVAGAVGSDGEGIQRVDFRDPDGKLEEVDWDVFFKTFEDRELAFLHQDETADGSTSRFFKFVRRGGDEHKSAPRRPAAKTTAAKAPARKAAGQPAAKAPAKLRAKASEAAAAPKAKKAVAKRRAPQAA